MISYRQYRLHKLSEQLVIGVLPDFQMHPSRLMFRPTDSHALKIFIVLRTFDNAKVTVDMWESQTCHVPCQSPLSLGFSKPPRLSCSVRKCFNAKHPCRSNHRASFLLISGKRLCGMVSGDGRDADLSVRSAVYA